MAGFEIDGGRLNLKTLLDFADVAGGSVRRSTSSDG